MMVVVVAVVDVVVVVVVVVVSSSSSSSSSSTVKTHYNVTCYNRIFNIRHKIAGNGSVSIKISSL